ncbi:Tll0287-like domain-containing protein [Rhodobacter sp. NSM]|uniref:Tll0287-like domain-containing protein n=1 Tax=Rhodobacter sp. NSM TaxID=3457501 RepID=UPI003FD1C1D1
MMNAIPPAFARMAPVFGIMSALATSAVADTSPEAQARAAIKQLQLSLQLALGYAMQEAGPEGAIETCNLKALPITHEISQAMGADIGRTALRLRNPANAPDAWEEEQLRSFRQRLAAGEPASTVAAVREDEEGFHLMQAIPMQAPCAVCHGTDVDATLREKIVALYPSDRATGFEPGELRGAFTVMIPRE